MCTVYCMKCGREIENGVFCTVCISKMTRYPVKPGTVVQIPYRAPETALKKNTVRKKSLTPEEQNIKLKKIIRGMGVTIGSLLLILAITVMVLYQSLETQKPDGRQGIGRNYSTAGEDIGG